MLNRVKLACPSVIMDIFIGIIPVFFTLIRIDDPEKNTP